MTQYSLQLDISNYLEQSEVKDFSNLSLLTFMLTKIDLQ